MSRSDARLSLLVVDDNDAFLASLTQWIKERRGIRLGAVAHSADEALDLLERESFDLVLVEARLCGSSGFEIVRRIKSRYRETRVAIMTLFGSHFAENEARRAGADVFLAKENLADELGGAIEAMEVLNENAPNQVNAEGAAVGPQLSREEGVIHEEKRNAE